MAIQVPCLKCNKLQTPFLNPKNDEVTCGVCDALIPSVSHFIKMQLKALKQYRESKKTPFAVKCPKCGKEERPKDVNGDIVCGACNAPLDHLTPVFKTMLKTQLGKIDKDV